MTRDEREELLQELRKLKATADELQHILELGINALLDALVARQTLVLQLREFERFGAPETEKKIPLTPAKTSD